MLTALPVAIGVLATLTRLLRLLAWLLLATTLLLLPGLMLTAAALLLATLTRTRIVLLLLVWILLVRVSHALLLEG
jgi:hypothetical protein